MRREFQLFVGQFYIWVLNSSCRWDDNLKSVIGFEGLGKTKIAREMKQGRRLGPSVQFHGQSLGVSDHF